MTAVLDENSQTIYLPNRPNRKLPVFDGAASFIWVTKPRITEGVDARAPNEGSEVPLAYSTTEYLGVGT